MNRIVEITRFDVDEQGVLEEIRFNQNFSVQWKNLLFANFNANTPADCIPNDKQYLHLILGVRLDELFAPVYEELYKWGASELIEILKNPLVFDELGSTWLIAWVFHRLTGKPFILFRLHLPDGVKSTLRSLTRSFIEGKRVDEIKTLSVFGPFHAVCLRAVDPDDALLKNLEKIKEASIKVG